MKFYKSLKASVTPVAQSQVLTAADFDEHQLGAEQQPPHHVGEEPGVYLRVGQLTGQRAAVADELVPTGGLVAVQGQDGHAEVRTGSLQEMQKQSTT